MKRVDRPHLFFAHQFDTCPGCEMKIEARVVFRDGQAVHLLHCTACGPQERLLGVDQKTYVQAFLERGKVPDGMVGDHLFKTTTSTCPGCLALVEAQVVIRTVKVNGVGEKRVFFLKDCTRCGPSEALVSEDAAYYVKAYAFAREGTEPLKFRSEVEHGCPTDCGTCDDHEQHTCLPIVEVTDHCNLECPICIVDNQYSTHMDPETFAKIVQGLVEAEGTCESLAISGGEPTSHPKILELIKIATRPEIGRVVIITNGIRLGKDRGFAKQLKDAGVYIGLQLDGFSAEVHTKIRGRDLCNEKAAALAAIRELDLPTQMIFVATKGINDHQIGQAVDLFLEMPQILSLNFQPVAYTGHGGGKFEHDPNDRLTIPGIIKRVEEQTASRLKYTDFFPLPCSHPQCVSLTYLLRLEDGTSVPFARFTDFEKYGTLLRSSATLPATPEVEDALADLIHDVFANQDTIERGADILKALRRSLDEMFPRKPLPAHETFKVSERQSKSIFLHHYMDRHDFDLERLRKCCHHYPQIDGRIMPACGFNMFHRGAAKGPDTPRAKFGRAPFSLPVIQ
ncbi:MAG: radical SAM protein [Deltaproteobacteria bacterium]|nr:radical SAM protein [Deltaproteobacteria bacterium]